MRCHICNTRLTRMEIHKAKNERGGYKPCKRCTALSTGMPTVDEVIDSIIGDTIGLELANDLREPE